MLEIDKITTVKQLNKYKFPQRAKIIVENMQKNKKYLNGFSAF